jgi:hypothetical protein
VLASVTSTNYSSSFIESRNVKEAWNGRLGLHPQDLYRWSVCALFFPNATDVPAVVQFCRHPAKHVLISLLYASCYSKF